MAAGLGIMVGVMKRGLQKAIQKTITEIAGSEVAGVLGNVLKDGVDSTMAVVANRLKSQGGKELRTFLADTLNVDSTTISKILKHYNQTANMAEWAKGDNYVRALRSANRQNGYLDISVTDRIKDIATEIRNINIRNNQARLEQNNQRLVDYNSGVKGLLNLLSREMEDKVNGMSTDENKLDVNFNVDMSKLFEKKKEYSQKHIDLLDKLITELTIDIEEYASGSGGSIVVTRNEKGQYSVYGRKAIINYINDIKNTVKQILLL